MKNLKKITMIVLLAALICAIPGGSAVGNVVAWAFETSPFASAFGAGDAVYADDAVYFYDDYYYVDDEVYYYDDYYYVDEYIYSDYDYVDEYIYGDYYYVDEYVYEDYDYADEYVAEETEIIDASVFNGFPDTVFALAIGNKASIVFGEIKENDVAPLLIDDARTMLPARFIAENLGATVEWDEAASLVTIKKDDIEILITIGSSIATVNGVEYTLDVPAFLQNGRTYTPVRFIAEHLGAVVDWDNDRSMVIITKAAEETVEAEVTEEETVEAEATEEEAVEAETAEEETVEAE